MPELPWIHMLYLDQVNDFVKSLTVKGPAVTEVEYRTTMFVDIAISHSDADNTHAQVHDFNQ